MNPVSRRLGPPGGEPQGFKSGAEAKRPGDRPDPCCATGGSRRKETRQSSPRRRGASVTKFSKAQHFRVPPQGEPPPGALGARPGGGPDVRPPALLARKRRPPVAAVERP